jgi:hypothetical protein
MVNGQRSVLNGFPKLQSFFTGIIIIGGKLNVCGNNYQPIEGKGCN